MPLVRLFVPSEEDENTLLNLAELIGLESEKEGENYEEESTFAGYIAFSIIIKKSCSPHSSPSQLLSFQSFHVTSHGKYQKMIHD